MSILRNREVIKTISVIILSFFCFACLLPSPAHSTPAITVDQLKRDVGQVINDMIYEILTPDMDTRELLKILLSGSKLNKSNINIYKNRYLNKLHDQILNPGGEPEDSDTFYKETTTIIAVLMLLSAEENSDGFGYLDLARLYLFHNVGGNEVIAESYCVLTAVQYYVAVNQHRTDSLPSKGFLKSYIDSINSIKTDYNTSLLNRDQKSALFNFDKHHSKIISIMEKATN
ncbi:MAG: hypothetical protein RBT80_24445 [Candidatus Vecturithrix sp.]|jgi:hypothetical protein|nr:hypothetical protein [Candidatus Vecturithrix sp.]